MPDGSLPNQQVVLCILEQLTRLELDLEDFEESDELMDVLAAYSNEGKSRKVYDECSKLAQKIINKYNRIKFAVPLNENENFDAAWEAL